MQIKLYIVLAVVMVVCVY